MTWGWDFWTINPTRSGGVRNLRESEVQGGPPVISGIITPISSRVITPVNHLISAIYKGPTTPFIIGFWAHLVAKQFSSNNFAGDYSAIGLSDFFC